MNLAKNIKAVALERGKTITDIANEMGKAQPHVSRLINNERITLQDLELLANVIGCNIMDFFAGASESKSEIFGFIKINGQIIEVRTTDDIQNITRQLTSSQARE